MAKRRSFLDRLPLAPVFALLFGTAIAIVIGAMPQWRFEQAVAWTGLGSLLSVAQPPLGLKARLLGVLLGFALVAIVVWVGVTAVEKLIARRAPQDEDDDFLDLRDFVDTLPPLDAPRRPIFADRELGAPFMSDEALKTVAAAAPTVAVAREDEAAAAPIVDTTDSPALEDSLEASLDVAEFDLPQAPDEPAQLPGESSIDTLIRRLEAGMARRAGPRPPTPPAAGPSPVNAMRDLLERNRDVLTADDTGSARALDTLQRLATRSMAG